MSTPGKKRLSILYDQTKKTGGGGRAERKECCEEVRAHSNDLFPNVWDGQGVK